MYAYVYGIRNHFPNGFYSRPRWFQGARAVLAAIFPPQWGIVAQVTQLSSTRSSLACVKPLLSIEE